MKKIKFIISLVAFILSFIAHNMYEIFPNILTSIFFPINESVWEHMKIIYTCILLASIIEYNYYKYKKIKVNNFLLSIPVISIFAIIIYLIIYYFIETIIPHNLYVSIALLLFVFILSEALGYHIINYKEIKKQKIIGITLIILSYLIFLYFTYYPLNNILWNSFLLNFL